MTKLQTLQRAKSYIEMLSSCIDPISGQKVPSDSVLSGERIRKCFSFVAEILDEAISTGGLISLPGEDSTAETVFIRQKNSFCLTSDEKAKIKISDTPIPPMTFMKNINKVIDATKVEKLSLTVVNEWLLKNGYITENKVPTVVNKTVKTITPTSHQIGIFEQEILDAKTEQTKTQLLFSKRAQEFILANIDAITSRK